MKQFDRDLRRNKFKNKDHFHMVPVKDIYEAIAKNPENAQKQTLMAPNHFTATIYSQDSNEHNQAKVNQQRYAEILVEQIKEKREAKLKEKADRSSLAIDMDIKARSQVKIPMVPNLIPRSPIFKIGQDKYY